MEYIDEHGYPTAEALKIIKEWSDPYPSLMEFVKKIWWQPDWGWRKENIKDDVFSRGIKMYALSTGGWSGNEDIIDAMRKNRNFWMYNWYSSRVGGHYEFRLVEKTFADASL